MDSTKPPGEDPPRGLSRPRYYRLEGHTPVPMAHLHDWARVFEAQDRLVARDVWPARDVTVSTVFLGVDHGYLDSQPPVLFETLVFAPEGSALDGQQWRYHTWDEAALGHRHACALVRRGLQERRKAEQEAQRDQIDRALPAEGVEQQLHDEHRDADDQ